LLDLGCGALRGGLHFIRYLDTGNYYGMDVNASLIDAGKRELEEAKLADRKPQLLVTEGFELGAFATTFDYAIAVSVFTHLPMNHIIQCLVNVRPVLRPGARVARELFRGARQGLPRAADPSARRHRHLLFP
jgi:SAM-dependent methyltransferase